MINRFNINHCFGCQACGQICPRNCISFEEDKEGFLYPSVDRNKCVDCGLCDRACPINKEKEQFIPSAVYAAYSKDKANRIVSSSGGLFFELAKKGIDAGSVIFGARFDEDWNVIIDYADSLAELKKFRGSKYVQALNIDSYKRCKQFLVKGREVIYSGTPCQIAGLKNFLGKDYENLLTIDFSCHGVPSPMVWRCYISDLLAGKCSTRISNIKFRDKANSWENYNFVVKYENISNGVKAESECSVYHLDCAFMKGFLENVYLRQSCYECPFKKKYSGSDITLGDYWRVYSYFPEMNDDKGVSLIMANTERGIDKIKSIESECTFRVSNYEDAKVYNTGLQDPPAPFGHRKIFFSNLRKGKGVEESLRIAEDGTFTEKVYSKFFSYCEKIKSFMQ